VRIAQALRIYISYVYLGGGTDDIWQLWRKT